MSAPARAVAAGCASSPPSTMPHRPSHPHPACPLFCASSLRRASRGHRVTPTSGAPAPEWAPISSFKAYFGLFGTGRFRTPRKRSERHSTRASDLTTASSPSLSRSYGPIASRHCLSGGVKGAQDFQSYPLVPVSARNYLMWNTRLPTASCTRVCWNDQECASVGHNLGTTSTGNINSSGRTSTASVQS
jgi:hypothetical protein